MLRSVQLGFLFAATFQIFFTGQFLWVRYEAEVWRDIPLAALIGTTLVFFPPLWAAASAYFVAFPTTVVTTANEDPNPKLMPEKGVSTPD